MSVTGCKQLMSVEDIRSHTYAETGTQTYINSSICLICLNNMLWAVTGGFGLLMVKPGLAKDVIMGLLWLSNRHVDVR